MINLKDDVYEALQSNDALLTLLDGPYIWQLRTEKGYEEQYPRITFFEIDNFDNQYAEDEAMTSRILFQVDLWGRTPHPDIVDEIDQTMKSLGFFRSSARDFWEDDVKVVHTAMRYKTTKIIEGVV